MQNTYSIIVIIVLALLCLYDISSIKKRRKEINELKKKNDELRKELENAKNHD